MCQYFRPLTIKSRGLLYTWADIYIQRFTLSVLFLQIQRMFM